MNEAERLTRLEERCEQLQRHVGEQDKVMLALSGQIDRLQRELAMLRGKLAGGPGEPGEFPDQRPPHY